MKGIEGIRYIPLEDGPQPYAADTNDNLVLAEGPGGLQVIASDEACALYVVKGGKLLREYTAVGFFESDGAAMADEAEGYLAGEREEEGED